MNKRMNNRFPNQRPGQQNNNYTNQGGQNRYHDHQNNHYTPAPSPVVSGQCVSCKAETVLRCQRCGDFYCSVSCQEKDWSKHRYICFQMPPLVHSSLRVVDSLPALNGYQKTDFLATVQSPKPQTPTNAISQHKKWVSDQSPKSAAISPSNSGPMHYRQQQDQQRANSQKSNSAEPQDTVTTMPKTTESNVTSNNEQLVKPNKAAFPRNNSLVLITAISSSNRVFIRSIEKEDNDDYCEVIKKISEFGRLAEPFDKMPIRNCYAITDFNGDGIHYRVQVTAVRNENEIDVIYCDFGNRSTKKLSELKKISQECVGLKHYVQIATLKGVPYIQNDEKLSEYLKSFEDTEARIMYSEGDRIYCDLMLLNADESLNRKINLYIKNVRGKSENSPNPSQEKSKKPVEQEKQPPKKPAEQEKQPARKPAEQEMSATKEQKSTKQEKQIEKERQKSKSPDQSPLPELKLPTPKARSVVSAGAGAKTRPSQLSKPVFVPPFETVPLPSDGKNLDIIIVDNSLVPFGYFSCVLKKDKSNLQAIQAYLAELEDTGRPYKPKVEEYCLAMFEGFWYRAKVLNLISPEEVEVVFIDFLNESPVMVSAVRRYPMNLTLPCKTNLCMIYDLPDDLSDNVQQFLAEKLSPGTEHKINEVKGMEEGESNVAIVKMNQITQLLSQHD